MGDDSQVKALHHTRNCWLLPRIDLLPCIRFRTVPLTMTVEIATSGIRSRVLISSRQVVCRPTDIEIEIPAMLVGVNETDQATFTRIVSRMRIVTFDTRRPLLLDMLVMESSERIPGFIPHDNVLLMTLPAEEILRAPT